MFRLSGTALRAGSQRVVTPKEVSGLHTGRSCEIGAGGELHRLGVHPIADAWVRPLPPSVKPLMWAARP
jgi:hypothetical protein